MADVFEFQSCCNEFQFTDPEDNFESWNGLRGPAGPAGPAGAPGTSVELRGPVASSGQLPATAPSSELWLVGTTAPYEGWFYNGSSWQSVGQIAVGPAGPAGPAGDPGSDGTTFTPSVSSAGVISWTNDGGKSNPDPVNIRGPKGETGSTGPGVPAGGTTGQVLAKASNADNDTEWVNQSGGGGTGDYNDLTNKPSINNVTLSGNKTAAELGLGTYSKPSSGIPQTDLAQTVQNKLDKTVVFSDTQPTDTENKLWVDTDASSGSTYQVPTVAEMDAAISSHVPLFRTNTVASEAIAAGDTRTVEYSIPQIAGYTVYVVSVHITDTTNINYSKVFFVWNQTGNTLYMHIFNTATSQVAPAPRVECLYLPT